MAVGRCRAKNVRFGLYHWQTGSHELDGILTPRRQILGKGLNRFAFNSSDVIDIMQKDIGAKKRDFLTFINISNILCVKQEVVAKWFDRGFIIGEVVQEENFLRSFGVVSKRIRFPGFIGKN